MAITAGPGGTVWFTERYVDKVGCIDTSVGTCAGGLTTTTVAAAVPVVAVTSTSLVRHGSRLALPLSCRGAPCAGKATFAALVSVSSGSGATRRSVETVLATGSYQLAAGARATVNLALTAAGLRTLVATPAHAVHGTVSVTLRGGTSVHRGASAR